MWTENGTIKMEEEQMKIAQIKAQQQTMQMRAQAFLNAGPEEQATEVSQVEQATQNNGEEVPIEQ